MVPGWGFRLSLDLFPRDFMHALLSRKKMAIEVMFGSRVGFPAELRFVP